MSRAVLALPTGIIACRSCTHAAPRTRRTDGRSGSCPYPSRQRHCAPLVRRVVSAPWRREPDILVRAVAERLAAGLPAAAQRHAVAHGVDLASGVPAACLRRAEGRPCSLV